LGGSITGAGAASAGEEDADGVEVGRSFFGAAARLWCVVVDSVFSGGAAGAAATGSVVVGTAALAAVVGDSSAGVTPIGVGGVIASDAPVSADDDVVVLASFGLRL
jgi:hypothetical protein